MFKNEGGSSDDEVEKAWHPSSWEARKRTFNSFQYVSSSGFKQTYTELKKKKMPLSITNWDVETEDACEEQMSNFWSYFQKQKQVFLKLYTFKFIVEPVCIQSLGTTMEHSILIQR